MGKLMPAQEVKQFKTYLETNIFHHKLDKFRQFRGGNASYCFHIKAGTEKYVAKILLGRYIFDNIHTFLSRQSEKLTILRGIKMDKVFSYGKYMATLQKNYGTVLPRRKFPLELLSEIFIEYTQIVRLCAPYKAAYTPNQSVSYNSLYEKVDEKKDLKSCFIKHFLQKVSPDSLEYKPEKLQIIHGDFNNNQVLLQGRALSAFIDWDSLRAGYPAEDYWEFIYFNLRRLYNPFSLNSWCRRLMQTINTAAPTPNDEWLYAINYTLFAQLQRLQEKFKLKYIWKFLWLYKISTVAVKYLETNNPARS